MRHTFAKLMAMLLMLTLVLSGCNLIDVNQMAVIEQQRAEVEKEYSAVLAEFDGGTVTLFDAIGPFYGNYSYTAQMYSMFGMELTEEDVIAMEKQAVEGEVINAAISKEFEARGLSMEKTEDEIMAEAQAEYDEAFGHYLEYAEGETDEEKKANAELALYSEGYTLDRLYKMYLTDYQAAALQADVEAEITEVSEEAIQAAYDERVAADEETYTATPAYFEEDVMNEELVVTWVPEGYRTVKHVLVIPEEGVLQAVTDARDALEAAELELSDLQAELETAGDDETSRTAEEVQADIDAKNAEIPALETAVADAEAACLASVKEKTDLIYADLVAGKSFDEVMAAYGEDPGMQSEPNMSTGYYVREDSYIWDANFTAGSMALENVGEYSAEPVISASGVHIIYYNADAASGAIPLEDVREALAEEALANLRAEHYEECMNEWYQALNPVYHLDEWAMS